MKKLLLLALISILAAFAFTACGNEEPVTPEPPITIEPDVAPPEDDPVVNDPPVVEETPDEEEEYDGIGLLVARGGGPDGAVTGALIVIGESHDEWPFATGTEGNVRAFDPEPGATYRITYGVTNEGTGGWRVRWTTNVNLFGDNTAGDYAIVNDHSLSPEDVATVIPAHFNQDVSPTGAYTLVVEITLDGGQEFDGLIGNIGLTGTGGSHDFRVDSVRIERLQGGHGTDVDELLLDWTR
ncbi:MAG: hypothetical protein FWC70_00570 [Defluviitaleaceae bacterium]|nr:hypothetical protein [Defluviitaleaceae bacterium]